MSLLPYPKFQAIDFEGLPLNGGKLYTYRAGTTTAKVAYSDVYLTTAHTNPIILDTNGECELYLSGKYKLILRDSDDTLMWTMDNISGIEGFEKYYVDSTETDQGAVGGGSSLKDLVDYIGGSKGTITLAHVSGTTTSYNINTSLTIPSNIKLQVEKGAVIVSGLSSPTLTINGPMDVQDYQIFSGFSAGKVLLSSRDIYPEWWGAVGDGLTDDSTPLQCALSSTTSGKIKLGNKIYIHSTALSITSSYVGIEGENWLSSILRNTSTTEHGILITSATTGNFLRRLKIDKSTTTPTSGIGVYLYRSVQPSLEMVEVRNYSTGVYVKGVSNLTATDVNVFRTAGTDLAYGFHIDGDEANASMRLTRCLAYMINHTGNSAGFVLSGSNIKDAFLIDCEGDQVDYGFYITSGGANNYDIHMINPISDSFRYVGIYIANNTVSDNMMINIIGGWTNPSNTGSSTHSIQIATASGVSIVSHQFFAGPNYANAVGLYANGVYRIRVANSGFSNFQYSIFTIGTNLMNQIIGNSFYNVAGQAANSIVNLVGFSRGIISQNNFDGYATNGIVLDANSGYNQVNLNVFNPTNITNKITDGGTGNDTTHNIVA